MYLPCCKCCCNQCCFIVQVAVRIARKPKNMKYINIARRQCLHFFFFFTANIRTICRQMSLFGKHLHLTVIVLLVWSSHTPSIRGRPVNPGQRSRDHSSAGLAGPAWILQHGHGASLSLWRSVGLLEASWWIRWRKRLLKTCPNPAYVKTTIKKLTDTF